MTKSDQLYQDALAKASASAPDYDTAEKLLLDALSAGSGDAAYALGTWYFHGFRFKKDVKKGFKMMLSAAQSNVPNALYDVAMCYEVGVGVASNLKRAFEYYLKAALLNEPQSVYEVGRCYFYGMGVRKERRVAKIWLDRAKQLGVED